MKCLVNSGRIVANKNKQVFLTRQLENKLLKACVLWMKWMKAWWAADVISEAFFTAITGDRYKLAAIDRNRSRYDPVIILYEF